jgi:hypothetical protein
LQILQADLLITEFKKIGMESSWWLLCSSRTRHVVRKPDSVCCQQTAFSCQAERKSTQQLKICFEFRIIDFYNSNTGKPKVASYSGRDSFDSVVFMKAILLFSSATSERFRNSTWMTTPHRFLPDLSKFTVH